ncbi:hypothetical protein GE061_008225 [Apolygus lucorum]|uniref:gamma-glutamylcyclotransferase n=1 Tax=Apolygus lucorum TaxID=248454 RepID=A0A8S9WP95_APOLU|nr:hypothetical protein GE061_008225 [Apolygus lucorum]
MLKIRGAFKDKSGDECSLLLATAISAKYDNDARKWAYTTENISEAFLLSSTPCLLRGSNFDLGKISNYLRKVPVFHRSLLNVVRLVLCKVKMCQSRTFKYFAFGSNLLTQRIHLNNPTAKRYDVGVLEKYRLDFGYLAKRWGGYVATIVPDERAVVWGAIWDIGDENLEDLDRQEGVKDSVYRPLEVPVKTPSGEVVTCRCYCLVNQPSYPEVPNVPNLLPSKVYMDTVIRGAIESRLPEDYVKMLEAIPNNGYDGPVNYGVN